jgi:hypothetical protein
MRYITTNNLIVEMLFYEPETHLVNVNLRNEPLRVFVMRSEKNYPITVPAVFFDGNGNMDIVEGWDSRIPEDKWIKKELFGIIAKARREFGDSLIYAYVLRRKDDLRPVGFIYDNKPMREDLLEQEAN